MKFSDLNFDNWEDQTLLESFLKENPRFNSAIIIRHKIDDNFDHLYEYDDNAWTVEMKGRTYNVILNDPWENRCGSGRKQRKGFIFKRIYQDGEVKITKRNRSNNYVSEHTSRSVPRTIKYKNDCQIWTLAKCCGMTYDAAAKVLLEVGWRENKTNHFYFLNALDILGFNRNLFWSKFRNNKGITLRHVLSIVPKIGTFSVCVKGHILCIVDGIIFDSCFNANARVEDITEITKI